MARLEITADHGQLKLGSKLVPGNYRGMSISGSVRIKEDEAQGQSGKLKQVTGYEDCTISLVVVLQNDDISSPYEKLKDMVGLFRKTDKTAKPEVYSIVNVHTEAWGLEKVLFKDLKTDDQADGDYIRATLEFVEWQSPLVAVEARAVAGPLKERTADMPTGTQSDVDKWQQKPSAGEYKEVIEVPDDD